ncbi:PadR family transcriptional regulator [Streptococcus oricebi]|uniref:PadR family transcriptional regulator n=1 Tax=Streptococcus oricebi TaxID=1547447 RepID=A0ABS5B1S0_9STRE|nr:helix-turn-helix transcriptional regulator [Streptococcus oricebi]MBP2622769.1 PadR family transcriptional regulator [Streptococcus oricebi]
MAKKGGPGALTEAVFYILLVLRKPTHGYGIMQSIDDLTASRVKLGPGTLYGALSTLTEKKWIEQIGHVRTKGKKEYVLTDLGREVLASEISRLEELLQHAAAYGKES